MAKIKNLSDLLNRMTGGNSGNGRNLWWFKDGRVGSAAAASPVANQWTSLWQYNGSPGHGAVPSTSPESPDRNTAGSLQQPSLSASVQQWLLSAGLVGNSPGILRIYDRVAQVSGLNSNVGTLYSFSTLNTDARYTEAESLKAQLFIEIYTQIGTAASPLDIEITDALGNPDTVSASFGGTGLREAQRMILVPVQQVLRGVRSVDSIQMTGAGTGTAGDYGLTIAVPIADLIINGTGLAEVTSYTRGNSGLIEIKDDACLAFAWYAFGTTVPVLQGFLNLVES